MATSATSSVSGLVSGLDTQTIISQLMQIESQGQTNLKTKLGTEQTNLGSLQDLNSTFSALATSAAALASPSGWNPVTVTSSSADVSATAGSAGVAGPLTFTIGALARAHQISFASTAAMTDIVATGPTVHLAFADGTSKDVNVGDGSLGSVINALNGSGAGVKASTVRLDDGSYRLQVSATATGAAKQFTLTNSDGSNLLGGSSISAPGQDAAITIGSDTLHSSGNTFTNVANGLTLTLKSSATVGSTVTLDATQDTDGMTSKVQALVDSINAALSKIDKQTAYDPTTKASGPLAGDAGVREVRNAVLNAVYPTDGSSLASVGIQLDRYGKLTFDATAFKNAYAADPNGVAAKFASAGINGSTSDGFAARIQTVTKAASDPITGIITASINGSNSEIKDLQGRIADWDVRLQLRQQTLQNQFTALETAMSQMNSQSSWLNSQIAGLSGSSSSSSGK